jgi:hypothetical protein
MIADGLRLVVEGIAATWRVTSAVTPAPPDQATPAKRIIVCRCTPHEGYNDTQS